MSKATGNRRSVSAAAAPTRKQPLETITNRRMDGNQNHHHHHHHQYHNHRDQVAIPPPAAFANSVEKGGGGGSELKQRLMTNRENETNQEMSSEDLATHTLNAPHANHLHLGHNHHHQNHHSHHHNHHQRGPNPTSSSYLNNNGNNGHHHHLQHNGFGVQRSNGSHDHHHIHSSHKNSGQVKTKMAMNELLANGNNSCKKGGQRKDFQSFRPSHLDDNLKENGDNGLMNLMNHDSFDQETIEDNMPMLPLCKRRIRARSESEQSANNDENCRNGFNGTVEYGTDHQIDDVNLKRSRDDYRQSPPRLKLNPCKSAIIVLHTHEKGNLVKPSGESALIGSAAAKHQVELSIGDGARISSDSDKELISPPAKFATKSCDEIGLPLASCNGHKAPNAFEFAEKSRNSSEDDRGGDFSGKPAPELKNGTAKTNGENDNLENVESEYSSLDDEEEEDDAVEDDDGDEGGVDGKVIGEDVFDAMGSDSIPATMTMEEKKTELKRTSSAPESSCVVGSYSGQGPLSQSLFPNVPVFLTFATHTEPGPSLPPAITKILKWKLTAVTPVVVRKVLINSGFRLLKQTNDWMGVWGKHMKSPQFRTIRSYQKFNHIPGTFQIGRKDRIWRNLQNQMTRNGKKEFGFMPRTYVLPQDLKMFRQMWPRYSQQNVKWIIKPPASARGVGIKVVNRWSQIPKRKPIIVQRYVERPLLIEGSKFDMRLYVLVTSINPLRVYLHTDGLARFASVRYSEKSDTLSDRYMHLTNYSINKLSANYANNEDADACQGHKWTIKSLWQYLDTIGVDTKRLWATLRNLVIRTMLAGENSINNLSKANIISKYNCFELFGFDVLLDSELQPWLLEVNISPSLHSASPLDLRVKAPLVTATLNTALYQIPPKLPLDKQQEILQELQLPPDQLLCHDKRIYTTQMSKEERAKHTKYANREVSREEYLDSILEELTPDDVRCLILTEDELARCAPLERIFPAPNTHKYLEFTESPRYYNRLLDAWESKYGSRRNEGIHRLQELCEKKVHLQVPQTAANVRKGCNSSKSDLTTMTTLTTDLDSGSSSTNLHQQYRESSIESNSSATSLSIAKLPHDSQNSQNSSSASIVVTSNNSLSVIDSGLTNGTQSTSVSSASSSIQTNSSKLQNDHLTILTARNIIAKSPLKLNILDAEFNQGSNNNFYLKSKESVKTEV